jgi:hypothetical protein
MARYYTGYNHIDAALVYREFDATLRALRKALAVAPPGRRKTALRATLTEVQLVLSRYQRDMHRASVSGSAAATKAVRQVFDETRTPRSAGKGSRLRKSLTARPMKLPLPTGNVGIGDVALMDRVTNPFSPGFGSYWLAQEIGTGANDPESGVSIRSQLHRRIFGFFTDRSGGGDIDVPRAGGGTHARFIGANSPGAVLGPRGGRGGPGEIKREIQGRHFLRDGRDRAYDTWLGQIRAADTRAIRSLQGLLGLSQAQIRSTARRRRLPRRP